MNELNPLLKKLLAVAHKADQADPGGSTNPPQHLVARVLRESAMPTATFDMSLLERWVQRAATVCAAVGVVTFSLQFLQGGASVGILSALTHGAVLFRAFLP